MAMALSFASYAQEEEQEADPPKVRRIMVNFTGLSNVNEEIARANMSLREGEEYDPMILDRDVRTLYRTGLFEHVEVRWQPAEDNQIDIVFDIRPKFRIAAIIFDGNVKVRDKRLEDEVEIKVNQVLNERKANDAVKTIRELYVKRGFSQVRVDYEIDRNPATGFGNVIFNIREGKKVKIKKVKFTGNENFKSGKLRRQIKTKKWYFLSVLTGSGKYDADQFEDDLETLKDAYRAEGYLDVAIDPSNVRFSYPSQKRMLIDINVGEGKQYTVGSIDFEGNELYNDATLGLMLSIRPGGVYDPEKLDENQERLEDFYGKFGYMETRVRLERIPNVSTGNIDLLFHIYESEKFLVESIDIEGNTKSKSKVIVRELNLHPGTTFDSVHVETTKLRLENTRFFEDVNASPQSTNVPGRKDLRITVQEGRTGNFSFGAGFSSLERGMFFVELTQSNFDIFNWKGAFQGDGQKFRLKAQLGSESSQIILAFEEPWLFERRLKFGFQVFSTTQDFVSDIYDSVSKGFEVYLHKMVLPRYAVEGRVAYSLVDQDFTNFSGTIEEDLLKSIGMTSSLNFLFLRDTRDRILNPFRGSRYELHLTYAGDFLGGDFDFYKIESRNAYYFPLTRWHTQTIEFLLRAGTVKEIKDSTDVPFEQRFFLGGPNTVRGFEFRDIGPIDPSGFYRAGGKTYGMFSAEYSIGFTEGFRGAIFYDGGFVNKAAGDFSPSEYWADNYGFGIRISVMGTPLRLDYGIPLTADIFQDKGSQFNFTFGGRF